MFLLFFSVVIVVVLIFFQPKSKTVKTKMVRNQKLVVDLGGVGSARLTFPRAKKG